MKKIEILSQFNKDEVNELRLSEYQSAKGFFVSPEGITWNRSDEQSLVLGIRDNSTLLSTMRLERISRLEILEAKIEAPWTFSQTPVFPVGLLSRAATLKSARGQGLNALLRSTLIEAAYAMDLHSLIGTFVHDSPRVESMKRMGYQFFEQKLGWNKVDFHSSLPVSVAILKLNADSIQQAKETCRSLYEKSGPFSKLQKPPVILPSMEVIK